MSQKERTNEREQEHQLVHLLKFSSMRATNIGSRIHQQPFEEPQDQRDRPRRRRTEGRSPEERNEQGSIIWTILLIGLTLCLADVAYILSYVDNQQDGGIDTFKSNQSPVWQIDQMNQQPVPAQGF